MWHRKGQTALDIMYHTWCHSNYRAIGTEVKEMATQKRCIKEMETQKQCIAYEKLHADCVFYVLSRPNRSTHIFSATVQFIFIRSNLGFVSNQPDKKVESPH
jgi:hypothetical protein